MIGKPDPSADLRVTGFIASVSEPEPTFETRLEQAKLAAMKELAYGASHEINNPLANISARAQALLRDERDPERRRAIEAINQQALRAHEMISDLMLFARPPRADRQPTDVLALVERVVAHSRNDCQRRGISLHVAANAASASMLVDAVQLEVAIKALITNAMEAIGKDGAIAVQLDHIATPRQSLRLTVSDDGPGIPPNVREYLFDPFYSGREAGRGLGFGLSKAWRIVTDHGGQIQVDSHGDAGATFVIELPAEPAA
jgi:signal transduction histidine kinase